MNRSLSIVLALLTLCASVLFAGCGGAGSALKATKTSLSAQTPASATTTVTRKGSGKVTVTVKWPVRSSAISSGKSAHSRLIPSASNSIQVALTNGNAPVASTILTRPGLASPLVSTYTFTNLAPGALAATATAFPSADGTGTAQALSASSTLTIVDGQTTPLTLTMNSTVVSIVVSGTAWAYIGAATQLTATALDASGNVVLVGGSMAFMSASPAVATVDVATGVVTGVTYGKSTITATYSEGGIPLLTGTMAATITDGYFYVADANNNRVVQLDKNYAYVAEYTTAGGSRSTFSYPADIVRDTAGNLYVADSVNNRIVKLSSGGVYLAEYTAAGGSFATFNYPFNNGF